MRRVTSIGTLLEKHKGKGDERSQVIVDLYKCYNSSGYMSFDGLYTMYIVAIRTESTMIKLR